MRRCVEFGVKVEIWSDVVCPWCYVGKRNFERALEDFEHRDEVEVVWRSFELDPEAPAERPGTYAGRLERKYGVDAAEAQAMLARMTSAAAAVGLKLDFDRARPGNTFDAHRLIHLAAERGLQGVLKERLLAATFAEGAAIGIRDELERLAVEAGLDPTEVQQVLAGENYAEAVRRDQRTAQVYGIRGVPFFLFDETYGLSGAQPPHVISNLLSRAWDETHMPVMVPGEKAGACDDGACAV